MNNNKLVGDFGYIHEYNFKKSKNLSKICNDLIFPIYKTYLLLRQTSILPLKLL